MSPDPDDPSPGPAATGTVTERIIEAFGGIRPMAAKLGVPVTTVQGWKKRAAIPSTRHADIIAAAAPLGIAIDPAELAATDQGGPEGAELAPAESGVESAPAETTIPELAAPEPMAAPEPPPAATPVAPPAAPAAPPVRTPARLAWIAAGVAMAAALVSIAAPLLLQGKAAKPVDLGPFEQRLAVLDERSRKMEADDLTSRVARLEAAPKPVAGAATAAPAATQTAAADPARLDALDQQVQSLQRQSGAIAALTQRVQELQVAAGGRELVTQSLADLQGQVRSFGQQLEQTRQTVTKLDAAVAERRRQELREEAVMLGVTQLRQAAAGNAPFAATLDSVKALARGDAALLAALAPLEPYAKDGAQTHADLRAGFAELAPELVRSQIVGGGKSWWRQALYRLSTVVSIRRVGDVPKRDGGGTEETVARAEVRVTQDDLAEAVEELKELDGLPAQMAQPWIENAETRLAVDAALDEVQQAAIARLSPSGPGATTPTPTPTPAPGEAP